MSQIQNEQCWGGAELSAEQVSDCCELILEDTDRFVDHDGWMGQTDWAEHGIDEQDSLLVKRIYQSVQLSKQKVVDEQLDKMLQQGIVEPSKSPWGFPTVLLTKKDGSVRFCVDFRLLNSLFRKDAYPLPRIDEKLSTLGGAEWFVP